MIMPFKEYRPLRKGLVEVSFAVFQIEKCGLLPLFHSLLHERRSSELISSRTFVQYLSLFLPSFQKQVPSSYFLSELFTNAFLQNSGRGGSAVI